MTVAIQIALTLAYVLVASQREAALVRSGEYAGWDPGREYTELFVTIFVFVAIWAGPRSFRALAEAFSSPLARGAYEVKSARMVSSETYVNATDNTSSDDDMDNESDSNDEDDQADEEDRASKVDDYRRGYEEGVAARKEYPDTPSQMLYADFMFGIGAGRYFNAGFRDGVNGEDMRSVDDMH